MNLKELLKLEKNTENIKLVEDFIKKAKNNFSPYELLMSKAFLAEIYFSLKEYSLSYINYLEIYEESKNYEELFINIIDPIIKLANSLESYQDLFNYYKDKNKYIKSYYDILYNLDIANTYILLKDYKKALNILENNKFLIEEDILRGLYLKIVCFFELKNYDVLKLNLEELKDKSILYNNKSYYNTYLLYLAKLYIELKNYQEAIHNLKELYSQKNDLDNNILANVVCLLLGVYIKLEDYRRASILETEQEEFMDNQEFELRKKFYLLCIEIYEKLNNKFSLLNYQNKLDYLYKLIKKKKKKNIIVNKEEDKKEVIVKHNIDFKEELLYKSLEIPFNLSFLEYFIIMNKHLQKHVYFNEVLFIDFKSKMTYQFKNNKCYDRLKTDLELDNTLFLLNQDELVLNNIADYLDFNDLILNKAYENLNYKKLVLFKDSSCGILFSCTDELLIDEELKFDLKFFYEVTKSRYFSTINLEILKSNYDFYINLFDKLDIPIKIIDNDSVILNYSFKRIVNKNDSVNIEEYLALIDDEYYHEYKNYLEYLKTNDVILSNIKFKFKNNSNVYKEYIKKDFNRNKNKLIFISYIIDITKYYLSEKKEIEQSKKDYLTNTFNKYQLDIDFNLAKTSNKFSFIIFNLDDYNLLNLRYGTKALQILKEIGKFLSSKYKTYHLLDEKFIILIDFINDKRTINNIANYLIKETEKIIYDMFNINTSYTLSSLRYPSQTKEKDLDKILDYLNIGLRFSKIKKEAGLSNHQEFSFDNYKKEVEEKQIILMIKENINLDRLKIKFRQVINLEQDLVIGFIPIINFPNLKVSFKNILKICDKLNYRKTLDYAILEESVKAISEIKIETNTYIKLFIIISANSFNMADFIDYIGNLMVKFLIPKNIISLLVVNLDALKNYEDKIKKLNKLGIEVWTNNFINLLNNRFNGFLLESFSEDKKHLVENSRAFINLLKNMKVDLILGNLDDKEIFEYYKELGVKKAYGEYIKKTLTNLEIIEKILRTK